MRSLVIRHNRWPYLLLAVAALGMGGLIVGVLFFWDRAPDESLGTTGTVILSCLSLVSAFLGVQWIRSFLRNAPVFTLDDEGFSYCPAGVSTGVVRWADVVEIRDITVTIGGSTYGPEQQLAVAVVLRDPNAYISRFPVVMRSLFRAREGFSGTPLVLDAGGFGTRYAEVRRAMDEALAAQRADARHHR